MSGTSSTSGATISGGRAVTSSRVAPLAVAIFAGLAVVPLIALGTGEQYLVVIATRMMIFSLAALSLNLVLGYGAMVSFGHAAYIGIGAYSVSILYRYGIDDIVLQVAVAMVVSAAFAFVTGFISLRTQGIYFIMITLAFGQMAYFLMVSLSAFGGDDGMTIEARSRFFGLPVLDSNIALHYVTFALLGLAFLFSRSFVASRFGRVLRGSRDNPMRMRAVGFSPFPYQLGTYVLASMIAAVAGVLLANQVGFVSPAYMGWQRSAEIIVMVVLGGMGTLVGPLIGAIALLAVEETLAMFSVHWKLGLGVMLILVVYFSRSGLGGLRFGKGGAKP